MTEVVKLEVEGAVAWVTLNRSDALNAINNEVRGLLPQCIRRADADEAVRVIVVRGAGERAFCAGADIKEFAPVESLSDSRQARVQDSWIRPFDEARKPVIASIHGYCLGGGLEIALACDIRIAARNATFAFPETGIGVMTGVGGSQRLPRVVGLGVALDMMLSGTRLDAERAFAIGLVSRLVDEADLTTATRELALTVASKAPLANAYAKEAVKAGVDLNLASGLRQEADLLTLLMNSEDRIEGAKAFKEKRKPRFRGR